MHSGQRLPTEAELMAAYGVSRTTVRSAVAALVERGLLVKRQGRGRSSTSPRSRTHSIICRRSSPFWRPRKAAGDQAQRLRMGDRGGRAVGVRRARCTRTGLPPAVRLRGQAARAPACPGHRAVRPWNRPARGGGHADPSPPRTRARPHPAPRHVHGDLRGFTHYLRPDVYEVTVNLDDTSLFAQSTAPLSLTRTVA